MHYFDPKLDAQNKGYEQFDQAAEISDTKSETSGNYNTAKASTNNQDKRQLRKYASNEPIG